MTREERTGEAAKIVLVVFVIWAAALILAWFNWFGTCEARGGTVRGNMLSDAYCEEKK